MRNRQSEQPRDSYKRKRCRLKPKTDEAQSTRRSVGDNSASLREKRKHAYSGDNRVDVYGVDTLECC